MYLQGTVQIISSSLGMAGALFIIVSWASFKQARSSFPLRWVFCLSIADLGTGIASIPWQIGRSQGPECQVIAVVNQFCSMSTLLWTACIAFAVKKAFHGSHVNSSMPEGYFHLLCWGLPAVISVALLLMKKFGLTKETGWCWIASPGDPWRLSVYGTLLLVMVYNLWVYITVHKIVFGAYRKAAVVGQQQDLGTSNMQERTVTRVTRRLTAYIAAFVITQFPALINRLVGAVFFYLHKDPPPKLMYILTLTQCATQPLTGLFNAIVYGATNKGLYQQYIWCYDNFMKRFSTTISNPSLATPLYHSSDVLEGT